MKTILVALDLEGESGAVLTRAFQLAGEHGAWLVLLHVIEAESLSHAVAMAGQSQNKLREELKRQAVMRIEDSLVETGRTRRTDVRVEFGSPHEVITRVAGELPADLVVLGPGRSPGISLREKVLGSTADRVIRTSPTPILVVKSNTHEPYRHIMVAVDFSPQATSAAQAARKLAPHARLQLVHTVNIPLQFEQALLRAGTSQAEMDQFRLARVAKAREDLMTFARDVVATDTSDTLIVEGEPGPALIRLAESHRVDLLALGPHGRGVILQALLGSVSQRVLREAACDVLVASTRK